MDMPLYQIRLLLHDKIQPIAFEYKGKSIPLEYSGHAIHKLANHWKSGYTRDRYNISPKENWAESIVHKQWEVVYWNSIFRVDDVQIEAINCTASSAALESPPLPVPLHWSHLHHQLCCTGVTYTAASAAPESTPLPALLNMSQLHCKLHWTSDRLRGDKTEPSRGIARHV